MGVGGSVFNILKYFFTKRQKRVSFDGNFSQFKLVAGLFFSFFSVYLMGSIVSFRALVVLSFLLSLHVTFLFRSRGVLVAIVMFLFCESQTLLVKGFLLLSKTQEKYGTLSMEQYERRVKYKTQILYLKKL